MNNPIFSLAKTLVHLATEKHIQICAAESCTGGALSAAITAIPGASKIFTGSVVSYTQSAKVNILKIPIQLLNQQGDVSPIIAKQMMQSALTLFGSDMSVGITGFAGPEGGTTDYPVGTVFIAFGSKNPQIEPEIIKLSLKGTRLEIIEQVMIFVLDTLILTLRAE